jgi:hypothetical protein
LNSTTSPTSCVSHWLDLDYASSDCTGSTAPMPCIRTRRLRRSTSPRTTCQGLLICVCFSMDFFTRATLCRLLLGYRPSHHEPTSSTRGLSQGGNF